MQLGNGDFVVTTKSMYSTYQLSHQYSQLPTISQHTPKWLTNHLSLELLSSNHATIEHSHRHRHLRSIDENHNNPRRRGSLRKFESHLSVPFSSITPISPTYEYIYTCNTELIPGGSESYRSSCLAFRAIQIYLPVTYSALDRTIGCFYWLPYPAARCR